jgi:SAM-dependent methyltransferase
VERTSFYSKILIRIGMPRDATILVVCGGELDREMLLERGYTNVTISNLDERLRGDEFAPYVWSFQDAECLSFPDRSFDYVIVHAGLHHCASPHRGVLEMYRVAREGVVVFEARDSLLMKAGIALKRVPSYELHAVRDNGFRWGGVRNSGVPNFIYRWTEREVQKTIASYAPEAPHRTEFFYGISLPDERVPFHGTKGLKWLSPLIRAMIVLIGRAWPKQGNQFAFFIKKPNGSCLFPWMKSRTEINREYRTSRTLGGW